MKNITIFKNFLESHNKKEIFLYGFYLTFISLLLLSAFLDYQIENYNDFKLELVFSLAVIGGLIYLYISKDIETGINIIVLFATFMTYILSASNGFGISFFHIIVPLSYFLLFTLRRALTYFFIHHSIVFSLYLYGAYHEQIHYNTAKLVGILIAVLFVLAFGVFYHLAVESSYKKLERAHEELEKVNYQKEILLNEIHHRIKNNLHMISSMLGLQQKDAKDPKLTKLLEKSRLRIQSIAMIHETLYKYDSFEKIGFYNYSKKLCDIILELYDSKTAVTVTDTNLFLSIEDTLRFGIITNELLTNSLKHAFKDEAGEVIISLKQTENHYIYRYSDNGKVTIDKKEFMKEDSLGLKIIHMMVEQMEAKLDISTENGLGFEIVVRHGP